MTDSAQAGADNPMGVRIWWVEWISDHFPFQYPYWKVPAQFLWCCHTSLCYFSSSSNFYATFSLSPITSSSWPSHPVLCRVNCTFQKKQNQQWGWNHRITEWENILCWKGPTRIINYSSWPSTEWPPESHHVPESIMQMLLELCDHFWGRWVCGPLKEVFSCSETSEALPR